jgi:hypothetical protein
MKFVTSKEETRAQDSLLIDETDIFSTLEQKKGTALFFGKYSLNEVLAVLRKRNFVKEAVKRKLWPLDFKLDSSEFPLQRFQIFLQENLPEKIIVDLKIKEGVYRLKKREGMDHLSSQYRFLFLEWLTLQNPLQGFTQDRTPLPGQKHPGLNLGRKVLDIFVYLARLNKMDGLLAFPAYYHNALLFSRNFQFFNPEKQGEISAIRRSFPDVSFKQLAWIVHLNCLRDKDGKVYKWISEEQVYPLNKSLERYFETKQYKKKVKEVQQKLSFKIDWACYEKQMEGNDRLS